MCQRVDCLTRVAPFGARTIGAFIPRPHEAFGLCALGLMQVKAAGLVQAFDLLIHNNRPE